MTEEQQIKEWITWYLQTPIYAWYLQPPINAFEVYGDALEFTAEEKAMSALLRKAQEK